MGIDPNPFSLYELLIMRRGREYENWDRLSFQIAHDAAFVGVKGSKINKYHKYLMHEVEEDNSMSLKELRSLKGKFPQNKGTRSGTS